MHVACSARYMQSKETVSIDHLLESYETALAQTGYSITTKLLLVKRAELIIRQHLNVGLAYFDQAIINRYMGEIDDKYFKGNMKKHYERTKREIDRFVSFVCTGRIDALASTLLGARQELTPKFKQIAEKFIAGNFHPNTRCDIRWVTYKYFAWLEGQGFTDMSGVGAIHIQKFLLACSEQYPPSTIHNIWLYMKKLYSFLHTTGQVGDNYSALFSFSVNREKKVLPVLPKSDIAKLLDTIDRSMVKGKRDYAIMMLGTVFGSRACDIVALKLTDIDWIRGEIHFGRRTTPNSTVIATNIFLVSTFAGIRTNQKWNG